MISNLLFIDLLLLYLIFRGGFYANKVHELQPAALRDPLNRVFLKIRVVPWSKHLKMCWLFVKHLTRSAFRMKTHDNKWKLHPLTFVDLLPMKISATWLWPIRLCTASFGMSGHLTKQKCAAFSEKSLNTNTHCLAWISRRKKKVKHEEAHCAEMNQNKKKNFPNATKHFY